MAQITETYEAVEQVVELVKTAICQRGYVLYDDDKSRVSASRYINYTKCSCTVDDDCDHQIQVRVSDHGDRHSYLAATGGRIQINVMDYLTPRYRLAVYEYLLDDDGDIDGAEFSHFVDCREDESSDDGESAELYAYDFDCPSVKQIGALLR